MNVFVVSIVTQQERKNSLNGKNSSRTIVRDIFSFFF